MNSEMTGADYFDEEETQEDKPVATLERLTKLAGDAKRLEGEIVEAEKVLAEKTDEYNDICRKFIPDIMEELALAEFKMTDGSIVKIKNSVLANLTEENKPAAYKWLEDNNKDGIIKTEVDVVFGRGEMKLAKNAMKALEDAGFEPTLGRSIHFQTLRAFVKEELERPEGTTLPIAVFGVFEFKEAKITMPPKPRGGKRRKQ